MKKIALIISMVALFSTGGYAQGKNLAFGLKFGPNIGWASSGITSDGRPGFGFTVGGIVDHYYSEHVALSSGLNLNMMRMSYTFIDYRTAADFLEEAKVPVYRKFKGSYLEVPLKVKVKVDVIDSWKAFVEAGVGFSFNYADKGKDNYDFYWSSYTDHNYADYFYQYRWLQTALNFGVGAMFEVNSKFNLFAQITVNNAISNTFTKDMQERTGSILRTNFIGIEIGICE